MNRTIATSLTLSALFASPFAGRAGEKLKDKPVKIASIDPETIRSRSIPRFVEEQDDGFTLRDQTGREMQAHLVSAHGETVKIQRVDDEKEFDVPIAMFDSETKDMIENWIDNDPAAVAYSLELTATRELLDSSSYSLAGRDFKTSKWAFKVALSNRTRNELRDAQIEYRIVFDDNVTISRTTAIPGKGANQQDGQSVDLPPIAFNDEVEFLTPPVETDSYEYKPNRGERDFLKDEVKGIWLRVVRHDEVIAEYKSNAPAMSGISWDNEDEVKITITNKFRDSFTETEE